MFFRRVTWRVWAGVAVVLVSYVVLGLWFRNDGVFEEQLYRWGLVSLTFSPVILLGGYTVTGNKWWRNAVGTSLGLLAFGITWMAWPLAWTFLFWNGMLRPGWVAWTEVSGPAVISLAALWFTEVNIHLDFNDKKKINRMPDDSGGV